MGARTVTTVGVYEPNEIFRRGLVASLADDPELTIVDHGARPPAAPVDVDVVVTSITHALEGSWSCPLVVCGAPEELLPVELTGPVHALLPRTELSVERVRAAVHAAAARLRIDATEVPTADPQLPGRTKAVLRLLAEGATTQEISDELGYSVRTIKDDVSKLTSHLGARTRAEAVAKGIRRGLI